MLKAALAGIRANVRRLLAVFLATTLAVVFLVSTLLVNTGTRASLRETLGVEYAQADAVVAYEPPSREPGKKRPPTPLDDDVVAQLKATGQFSAVQGFRSLFAGITNSPQEPPTEFGAVYTIQDPAFSSVEVLKGEAPADAAGILMDEVTARQLSLDVGSTIHLSLQKSGRPGAGALPEIAEVKVTGLVASSDNPSQSAFPQLYATGAALNGWAGDDLYRLVLLKSDQGQERAAEEARQVTGKLDLQNVAVRTAEEQVTEQVARLTRNINVLTGVLLAFAAIALAVAALVIQTTFTVLVAQRTRELALLRCLGANRSQVRDSVLLEAAVVGLASSVAGVAGGYALLKFLLWVAPRFDINIQLTSLPLPPWIVGTGVLVGVAMTTAASLIPARNATKVAPLAALRPVEDVGAGTPVGRRILAAGGILCVAGTATMAVCAFRNLLIPAAVAGIFSFIGLLMCARLFIPGIIRALGGALEWVLRRGRPGTGVPLRLASLNAVRNPARTSATAAALLIGVTLVSMIATGASTARQSLDEALDRRYPVDLQVSSQKLPQDAVELARGVDGVAAAVPAYGTLAQWKGAPEGEPSSLLVTAVKPDDFSRVAGSTAPPSPGVMLDGADNGAPGSIELATTVGSKTFTVQKRSGTSFTKTVAHDDLLALDPAPALTGVWVLTDPGLTNEKAAEVRRALTKALGVTTNEVNGAVLERASFDQVIGTLLGVILGLLAVAVVIAFIGVTNTISLSVHERTRESALLRALGLKKSQLRGMLALEACLIAGVAGLAGALLGVAYGLVGSQAALGSFTTVRFTVPWGQVAMIAAVAALCGLLASVLPGRRAARMSPVKGLGAV